MQIGGERRYPAFPPPPRNWVPSMKHAWNNLTMNFIELAGYWNLYLSVNNISAREQTISLILVETASAKTKPGIIRWASEEGLLHPLCHDADEVNKFIRTNQWAQNTRLSRSGKRIETTTSLWLRDLRDLQHVERLATRKQVFSGNWPQSLKTDNLLVQKCHN